MQLGQIGLRHGDAREMRDAFDGGEIDRHGGLLRKWRRNSANRCQGYKRRSKRPQQKPIIYQTRRGGPLSCKERGRGEV
ncbi:hypothetical protein OCUBac02_28910 [Bosea sp. ANAM02]|nr:hypothetical protein OCUBac02_28910 [Bosea sp. ANAM02]